MKKFITIIEAAAIIISLFVLGSECDDLSVFVISKLVALAIFAGCAYHLNFFTIKHK